MSFNDKDFDEVILPELPLHYMVPSKEKINWDEIVVPAKSNVVWAVLRDIKNCIGCDIRVVIADEEFNCHIIVLQCYSTFFEELGVNVTEVKLPPDKVTPYAFSFFYNWARTDGPYEGFNEGTMLEVFVAAKYLKIKALEEQCWSLIDNRNVFYEVSAFKLFIEARKLELLEVCELMLSRIQKSFIYLVPTKEFAELSLTEVQAILNSNLISLSCEMEVYMTGFRWLDHDWENRSKYIVDVLGCTRFSNMKSWEIVNLKRIKGDDRFAALTRDERVVKLFNDGLVNIILKKRNEGDPSERYSSTLNLSGRNWAGKHKSYFSYRQFLIFLDRKFKSSSSLFDRINNCSLK